ncbi:hypothetical protein GTV32_09810 [Gordonia sp. SID5947]|uniref:WXG100 family type VII secretion target n=1 Tax=Gordonia sp. SID5947 TaxID=2690315 RepID=UPI00136EE68E|nr:hypothetical protein [Gordonia sp. SID5947]MYR06587.1 hypothetical protein [Gordonia sp. SID5947]
MCGKDEYENPFAKLDPDDASKLGKSPTLARDGAPSPAGTSDMPAITTEPWTNRGVYSEFSQISDPLHTMNEGLVHTVAQNWKTVAATLQQQHTAFFDSIARINHWKGDGADAAQRTMTSLASALADLQARTQFMGDVMQNAADTVNVVKNNIPTTHEVASKLEDAGATYAQREDAKDQLLEWASQQMTAAYDPGIRQVAAAAPMFSSPVDKSNPNMPGAPSSPGGLGGGPSGTGGAPPPGGGGGVPDLSSLMAKTPENTSETASLKSTPTVPSGLTSGLQQAGNLGQSAAGQAQSAVDKLKSLAKNPLATPGLHALDALKKGLPGGAAALGKLGGGGGKGGGAGAVGKFGGAAQGLSELEKTAMARGAKSIADAERAALSGARGASPSVGGPMGAGGAGGARGAGGEDKEHKANKFLQTTRNGAELVGVPPQ